MGSHSSWVAPIDEVIHVDNEVLVMDLFAIMFLHKAYGLLLFVKMTSHCLFCFIVSVFVRVKLQKTNEIVKEVIRYIELVSSYVILLIDLFKEGNLLCGHKVVNAHEKDPIAAHTLHLSLHVNYSPVYGPVFDEVTEF